MSYGMPGMEYYPQVIDAPTGGADLPVQSGGFFSGGGISASGSYSGSFDVGTAIIIFAVLWFGSVGALHLLSNASDKL
jgi:hypothetical protein